MCNIKTLSGEKRSEKEEVREEQGVPLSGCQRLVHCGWKDLGTLGQNSGLSCRYCVYQDSLDANSSPHHSKLKH